MIYMGLIRGKWIIVNAVLHDMARQTNCKHRPSSTRKINKERNENAGRAIRVLKMKGKKAENVL